jgi:DNA-binding XRE family transcriptional regulator
MNAPINVQILNGPDGRPAYVVIPYDDYIRDHAEIVTPHEVVGMMVKNDWTPVRAWREHLALTQQQVAERMGISQSAYAQQEVGTKLRKASRDKIAAALGIATDLLDV